MCFQMSSSCAIWSPQRARHRSVTGGDGVTWGSGGKVKRAADFSGCGGSSLHLLCSCLGSNPARARGQKRVCRMRWKRGVQ